MSSEVRHRKQSRAHPLLPCRSIKVITEKGPTNFSIAEISADSIGLKAFGLTSIPSEWVPPFFVITASCIEKSTDKTIHTWIIQCLTNIGIREDQQVMIRSSGTRETMQQRGQFTSMACSTSEIVTKIKTSIDEHSQHSRGAMHWVVQLYISSRGKGHLSNERRLRKENRDWITEFEPHGDKPGYTAPISVRRWRDGTVPSDLTLHCNTELAVTLLLKRVAMWASMFSSRIHFEWVWDGREIYIVQAQVEEHTGGVDPRLLLKFQINSVECTSLKMFHQASQEDYNRYGKLRNAKIYREIGYDMPIFYVLDDPVMIKSILSDKIPPQLECDLVELTKRPLVIRSDGKNIPSDKREMLPRSEELRSYTEAKNWLLKNFKPYIEKLGLTDAEPCLIAHHFIPSVSSAWARAEPHNRIVRIESLWGIPEGLYWYSHDTFEVDTQKIDIDSGRPVESLKYKYWKRLRYKGTFIAPNEKGKWRPYQTAPPYDWNKSISQKSWLFEIANTTRQVAERENHAVSIMWFVDNHPQATKHRVLPWFHSKSELTDIPKAAPRKKRKSAKDFSIKSVEDWKQLQKELKSDRHIERVVVEPTETALIRNPEFAKDLADLAASKKFVVELSGGILSHVYYILQHRGAQVECVDLFGTDEDVVGYNKLVRDKVPNVIGGRGERAETVQLAGEALLVALQQKLVEEAFEALDAKSGSELISELSDIQEVVRALCRALGVNTAEIEAERAEKENRRGGFEKGLMLIKTSTPHSIQKPLATPQPSTLDLVISEASDLPAKPVYRRPDLRQVDQMLEKLFTFKTDANKISEIKSALDFSMPIEKEKQRNFTLVVEMHRVRSELRGIVRLRLHPLQLEIEFPDEDRS